MIITYIIKSTLCLAILFGFYKIVLEAKALHHFKRYYLLASLVFSLTIPLVTFTYTTTEAPQEIWIGEFAQARDQYVIPSEIPVIEEKTNYLPYIIWSIYGIGVLIFGGRFLLNLIRLKRKITTAETHDQKDFTLALLQQSIIPHSFLKYIFLSRKRYKNKEIPSEVIAHEATHVRQKHSLDILFIEFLQVVFWFNPLFWITKKSITLNHEFLADQGAIQEQHNIYQYQHILLNYASSAHHTTLESPFNYSSTKKRILMLSQSFNKKRLAISALLLIPIIAGCVLVFNQGIIAQASDLAIAGHWIDQEQERSSILISNENGSLSLRRGNSNNTTLITEESGNYFIESTKEGKREIKIDPTDQTLVIGEQKYIAFTESLKMQFSGLWENEKTGVSFVITNNDGMFTWTIREKHQEEGKMYWPNLTDTGFEFAQGDERSSFTIKQGAIIDDKGNIYQKIKTTKDIEHLDIKIIDDNNYMINNRPATNASLKDVLESFNTNRTKEEIQQLVGATILEPKSNQKNQITMLQEVLKEHGIKKMSVYMGTIFPSTTSKNSLKEKYPTEQDLKRWLDASQYGIWINGVRVRNEVLTAYKPDDLPYFTESTLEKNAVNYGKHYVQVNLMSNTYWREKGGYPEGYEEILESLLQQKSQNYANEYIEDEEKNEFVEGAERNGKKAFVIEIKNNSISINGKESSIRSFQSDIDAITKDWEEIDYTKAYPSILIKSSDKEFLKKLNKEYLKTHYSKANGGRGLLPPPPPPSAPKAPEAQLPPPPPPPSVEDHLKSMKEIGGVFYYENEQVTFEKAIRLVKANKSLNVQTRHPYTNAPKTYISIEPITFYPEKKDKKPLTKEDIQAYNKLAKKYNKNPNGAFLKTDVVFMYDIYNRMTDKQKKNAEPYPALPSTSAPKSRDSKKSETPKSGQQMVLLTTGETRLTEVKEMISTAENIQESNNQQEMIDYLKDANSRGAILTQIDAKPSEIPFYNARLSLDSAIKLIKDDPNMRLYPTNRRPVGFVVLISNNVENMIPKLSSENRIKHISSLMIIGAKFYVNEEEVNFKKARKFLKKNKNAKINSTTTPPIVRINT